MKGKNLKRILAVIFACVLALSACQKKADNTEDMDKAKIKIVATTTQLADMVNQIAGDTVEVTSLMGPGIDPHLYKPSAGDYESLEKADMIVYNGLNLEGKLGTVIEHLSEEGKQIVLIFRRYSGRQTFGSD